MVRVGKSVVIKGSLLYGVVIGLSDTHFGFFRVRIWDHNVNRYRVIEKLPISLTEMESPIMDMRVNLDDPKTAELYREIAVSLALDTKDREWFNSLSELDTSSN